MTSQTELRYFIEIANTQNLSRAAEKLGITQPSLSIAIKRLEVSIGTNLLIRQKKGVCLTQAGKQLLAHAKHLLQYWNEIKSKTLASHNEIQGDYKIGCHPSVGLSCLSGFLPELLLKNPKLQVSLEHDISRKITERIINLSLNIGVVVNPVKHPDLIIQKLKTDEVTFWKFNNTSNKNQNIKSGDAIVICDPELTQTQWLLKKAQKKLIQFSRILLSSNLEIIANLTANGCGIGILPGSVASSTYDNSLKRIPKAPVFKDEICLIYRDENRRVKAISTIVNSIKHHYRHHT